MPVVNRLAGDDIQQIIAEAVVQDDGRPAAEEIQTFGSAPSDSRRGGHYADVLAAAPNQDPMPPFDRIKQL